MSFETAGSDHWVRSCKYTIKNVVDDCIVEILGRPAKHFADKTSKYSQRCQLMKIQNLETVSCSNPLPPIGNLSNDDGDGDGDGNENGKKSNRFRLAKKNNFARASRFFVHFFALTARLRRENA